MKKLSMLTLLLLAGCGHLNGLIDAGDQFGCGVAPGVRCATLTDNFERQERAYDQAQRLEVADDEEFAEGDAPAAAPETVKPRGRTKATADEKVEKLRPTAKPARQRRPAMAPTTVDERYPRAGRAFSEPRRAAEVVMQLWVMPWVDADGDFHAESRVWLKVKDARWQIERERSRATARAADPGDLE